MPTIQFEIVGMPQGKGRPKFCKRGDFVTAYTPKKTKDYELMIRGSFLQWLMENPGRRADEIGDRPFNMDVVACFNPPASMPKKKQAELVMKEVHTNKPDIDNIVKVVLDALNEVAFNDDSQLVFLTAGKRYSWKPASVEVTLSWENNEPF